MYNWLFDANLTIYAPKSRAFHIIIWNAFTNALRFKSTILYILLPFCIFYLSCLFQGPVLSFVAFIWIAYVYICMCVYVYVYFYYHLSSSTNVQIVDSVSTYVIVPWEFTACILNFSTSEVNQYLGFLIGNILRTF